MIRARNVLFNISLALNILLLFLVIFESRMELPLWLQVTGRMHPLFLHFPIVLLIVLIFVEWNNVKDEVSSLKSDLLLLSVSLMAVITSLMGLFLSREEGYNEELINWHKWGGVSLSFLVFLWYLVRREIRLHKPYFYAISFLSILLLIITGHQGADLTHGEDFLFEPYDRIQEQAPVALEDAVVFTHMVKPIIQDKCISCHNEKKAKGELIMETEELLLKGGKNGKLWDTLHDDLGLMFERINLPMDQKKHMPPKSKPQLTEEEILILEQWVRSGASFTMKVVDLPETDTLRLLAKERFGKEQTEQYDFDPADESVVNKLSDNYRKIEPIAAGSPALKVSFYGVAQYEPGKLKELAALKNQVVELNLNKMPVEDADVKVIASMKNLRKLNLSFTKITGKSLKELNALKELKHLSLSGTKVQEEDLALLKGLPELKKLEVWNTPLEKEPSTFFAQVLPKVEVETGFSGDTVVIQLNSPVIENEEQIFNDPMKLRMKHYIKDVAIRYTLDGTDPDSIHSPIYNGDVEIRSNTKLRAKAFKPGWISSPIVERNFYRSSVKPDSAYLLTTPEPNYKGEGAKTLINGEKGDFNFRSGKWLGYRNGSMELMLYFNSPKKVSSLSLSTLVDIPSYIMPAQSIELYEVNDKGTSRLIKRIRPAAPVKEEGGGVMKGFDLAFDPITVKQLKLVVKPFGKLPSWHRGKGENGWFFIDEVLLN